MLFLSFLKMTIYLLLKKGERKKGKRHCETLVLFQSQMSWSGESAG